MNELSTYVPHILTSSIQQRERVLSQSSARLRLHFAVSVGMLEAERQADREDSRSVSLHQPVVVVSRIEALINTSRVLYVRTGFVPSFELLKLLLFSFVIFCTIDGNKLKVVFKDLNAYFSEGLLCCCSPAIGWLVKARVY